MTNLICKQRKFFSRFATRTPCRSRRGNAAPAGRPASADDDSPIAANSEFPRCDRSLDVVHRQYNLLAPNQTSQADSRSRLLTVPFLHYTGCFRSPQVFLEPGSGQSAINQCVLPATPKAPEDPSGDTRKYLRYHRRSFLAERPDFFGLVEFFSSFRFKLYFQNSVEICDLFLRNIFFTSSVLQNCGKWEDIFW